MDCGTGMGVVTTENKVVLGEWSIVTVTRKDWDATVKLNDGDEVRGRSRVRKRVFLPFPLTFLPPYP